MVNSSDCFTSLFSSQLILALTLADNPESSPMQYNNYVTLHRIWAHMHFIGADSTDSINTVTP